MLVKPPMCLSILDVVNSDSNWFILNVISNILYIMSTCIYEGIILILCVIVKTEAINSILDVADPALLVRVKVAL